MCQMLPSLVFVLIGGLRADRVELRRVLGALHLASAASATGLAVLVGGGCLGLAVLLPSASRARIAGAEAALAPARALAQATSSIRARCPALRASRASRVTSGAGSASASVR